MQTSLSLLAQVQAQENDAWSRLYTLYEPLIRHWILRDPIARLEAEDLVQDVMLSVQTHVMLFEHKREGSFRKWLRVITVNRIAQFLRKRRPQQVAESIFELFAHPDNPLEEEWNKEYDRHVIRKLLEMVRPEFGEKTWRIFEMTEFEGIPSGEAARQLQVTPGTVYMARNRILSRLREIGDQILEY
ncbi:sigma-70 family RNA polymerase sigma factor [Telmatocola sphagniphila]|uniref:Sigma-70 family RNA polymerase sigma factor n=1 Tax=Telmatocola sphagniphila TaxID=1123043 RepID=A0A8E6B970_9BACT|nr:sigma-70 family RNA polymerase sigma factor [Telmatocola sphagniphila]QVL32690.1 sigma-70 family RNA polymerase sigma factor [Telmatocola sphagniphila]